MKTKFLKVSLLLATAFSLNQLVAQDNVGVGTVTPNASAKLDIVATDKGLLIPRVQLDDVTTAAPVTAPATGLLVFNETGAEAQGFYYWDGTQWVQVGAGGGVTCVTLDEAYDCTTAGAGRLINVTDGEVHMDQTAGANNVVLLTTSIVGTAAAPNFTLVSSNAGVGNAIYAENINTGADQTFPAIDGEIVGNTVPANSTTILAGVQGGFDGLARFGTGGFFYASTPDGGVGSLNLNFSPSTANTTVGSYGWTAGGGGVRYGLQGIAGDGVAGPQIYSSANLSNAGVYGVNENATGGAGVLGEGVQGVVGVSDFGAAFGVAGINYGNDASLGTGTTTGVFGDGGYGVTGQTQYAGGVGVFGNCVPTFLAPAGYAQSVELQTAGTSASGFAIAGGGVGVLGAATGVDWALAALGDIAATGLKDFAIDHPEDPENKILRHFSMESNEVLNVYRGNATFDANGNAVVTLPSYFDDINIDFSYSLTAVGAPGPNMYVSKEIAGNTFEIAGGQPGAKVSWSVYAKRNDEYVKQNPSNTINEVEKPDARKGKYLMPQLYGANPEDGYFNTAKQEPVGTKGSGKAQTVDTSKAVGQKRDFGTSNAGAGAEQNTGLQQSTTTKRP